MAVIETEEVVVHLALSSVACIVCTAAQSGSPHYSGVPIHVDEQRDGNIGFQAMLNWFHMACPKDGTVESNEGRLGKGSKF